MKFCTLFLLAFTFNAHAQWVDDYENLQGTSAGGSTLEAPQLERPNPLLPPPSHHTTHPQKETSTPSQAKTPAVASFQEGFLVEDQKIHFGPKPVATPSSQNQDLKAGKFAPFQLSNDADELLKKAQEHLENGEAAKAVNVLNHLVKLHPENAEGLELLGDAYMQNYQYQQAIATYGELVELKQDFHSLMKQGFAHNKQGQVQIVHKILSEIRRECGFWCDEYKMLKRAVTRRDNYRNRIHDRDDNQDRYGRGYDSFDDHY